MNTAHVIISSAVAALVLSACASAAQPDAPATGSSHETTAPASTKLEGRYAFALEDSDVAAVHRERCAKERATERACFDQVRIEAAKEGIRFGTDKEGRLVWTSYGDDEGVEQIYIQVPIETKLEAHNVISAKPIGKAAGTMIAQRPLPESALMRFEIVDAKTVAMHDPQKGRLVFRKIAD